METCLENVGKVVGELAAKVVFDWVKWSEVKWID